MRSSSDFTPRFCSNPRVVLLAALLWEVSPSTTSGPSRSNASSRRLTASRRSLSATTATPAAVVLCLPLPDLAIARLSKNRAKKKRFKKMGGNQHQSIASWHAGKAASKMAHRLELDGEPCSAIAMEATAPSPELPEEEDPQQGGKYTEQEVRLMRIALEEAKGALERREVPVGAVLANDNGEIVVKGSNRSNEVRNATRHAEIEALDKLTEKNDPSSLKLVVTCEPCIMCAAALSLTGITRVVFGCANDKFGGCGSVLPVHDEGCVPCGRSPGDPARGTCMEARGGLYEAAAVCLLREFYMRGNPMAPKPQRRPVLANGPSPHLPLQSQQPSS